MDDLKRRFRTLDDLPVPDLWADIEARSAGGVARLSGGLGWGTALPSMGATAWILLALLLVAAVGAALIGGALRPEHLPDAVAPVSPPPSSVSVVVASPSAADHVQRSQPPTGCPPREQPAELRVVPVRLPSYPAQVAESGCRVWIRQGTNGAGIVRLNAELDAPDATVAPAEITVIVDASDAGLWAEAAPAVTGPGDVSNLGRIDPATAAWEPQIRLPANHATTAIAGDVIWLRDWRSVHTWTTRLSAEASVAPQEISVPAGQLRSAFGSMWVFAQGKPSTLRRFDPADQRLLATVEVGTAWECLDTSDGFVCSASDGQLIGVSAATNRVEWSVTIPRVRDANVAVVGGSAWVQPTRIGPGRMDADELIEVDLATGNVLRRLPFAVRQPNGLWGAAGSLWVLSDDPGVVRVDLPTGG